MNSPSEKGHFAWITRNWLFISYEVWILLVELELDVMLCLWLRVDSQLPALTQNIPAQSQTKPLGKKRVKLYVEHLRWDSRGYFYIRKGECFQICKLIEPGHFQLFVMFPIERPDHRNNKIRGWGYTFSWTRMNLSCVAFFCSLQNWWGRGIPNSENLFSIRLNFCLRNAEQLEDFVSVINLCPFVGVSKLLKSGNCQVAGRRTGDLSCTQILGPMYGLR